MNPSTKPSARGYHAMAYDSQSDRIVLFGGGDGAATFGDTWAYDFGANTWMNKNPKGQKPSPRVNPAMAYDSGSDRIVLFGGYTDAGQNSDETWVYDLNANRWTQKAPVDSPSPRYAAAMAYDADSDQVVLFGGGTWGTGVTFDDTWAYDVDSDTWQLRDLPPPATYIHPWQRRDHTMVYHSASDRVVLCGGWPVSDFDVEPTHTYDYDANEWTTHTLLVCTGRKSQAMTYDTESSRGVLFGGDVGGAYDDNTYAYIHPDPWYDLNPSPPTPSGRFSHAMAYDSQSDRTILFGGITGSGANDETWAYHLILSVPGPPRNLRATPGNGAVTLNWLEPTDWGSTPITNYKIYRDGAFLIQVGDGRTYTNTGLTNGQRYCYRVSAVNAIGEGVQSDEACATPGVPGPPTLTATPGAGQVDLTWTAPPDNGSPITNYRLYRGTSPGTETFYVDVGNYLTYIDSGVVIGQLYCYQVSAENARGEGPRSNEACATPYGVPDPPILTATPGAGQIVLTWTAPPDNGSPITNYRIYRGTVPGGETFYVEVGNVLTYTDTAVAGGQLYCYQVSAVNAAGEGPRSNEACATPPTGGPPSEPRNLVGVPGKHQVVLTWDAPLSDGGSAITNYKVYRDAGLLITLGPDLTHTDTGLTAGRSYCYRVSAMNVLGEGPLSNEVCATPFAQIVFEGGIDWTATRDAIVWDVTAGNVDGDPEIEIVTVGEAYTGSPAKRRGQVIVWRWDGTNPGGPPVSEATATWAPSGGEAAFYGVAIGDAGEINVVGWAGGAPPARNPVACKFVKSGSNLGGPGCVTHATPAEWLSLQLADIAGDSAKELIASGRFYGATEQAYLVWFTWGSKKYTVSGSATWTPGQVAVAYDVFATNVDGPGDPRPEILTVGSTRPDQTPTASAQLRVWKWNIGSGAFAVAGEDLWTDPSGGSAEALSVFAADAEPDGIVDIFTAGYTHDATVNEDTAQLRAYVGQPTLAFMTQTFASADRGNRFTSVHVANVDPDPALEVVIAGWATKVDGEHGDLRLFGYAAFALSPRATMQWRDFGAGSADTRANAVWVRDVDGNDAGLAEILTGGQVRVAPWWAAQLRIWYDP